MGLADARTNRILEDTPCHVCGRITRATGVVACYQGERIRTPAAFQLWGRASAVFLRLSLPATFSHLPLFLPRAPFTRRHSRRRLLLAHSQPLLYVSPTNSQPTVSPTYGTTEPECFAKGWEAAGSAINAKNTETLAIPSNKGLHNLPRWRWSSVTPFSCARTCKNGTNCFAGWGGVMIITAYLCPKCNDPCTLKSGAMWSLQCKQIRRILEFRGNTSCVGEWLLIILRFHTWRRRSSCYSVLQLGKRWNRIWKFRRCHAVCILLLVTRFHV